MNENRSQSQALDDLTAAIRGCRQCRDHPDGAPLPHEPRPVLHVSATARLLIASQAPGARVHRSGLSFDDPSGDRLRAWTGLDRATFYDSSKVALAAMGFCFPGHDSKKGDLPPRRECARLWHDRLFALMPQVELILMVGLSAQRYHYARFQRALPGNGRLLDAVRDWRACEGRQPRLFPLPHPSWRNTGWLKANPWFESELLPDLRASVRAAICSRAEKDAPAISAGR